MSVYRKCNSLTLLLIVAIIMVVGFSFLSLQERNFHVNQKEHEIRKRREHENILQEKLKVVYHHTSRVEEELKKEREKHKKTLLELLDKKKEFHSNITKTKHEAWTRFRALDSDYKMLKAEHEETKTNYLSLQAQYQRLSSDHQRIVKESRLNYEQLKNSKNTESLSLQDRIQVLYKKNAYYYQLAEQNEGYYAKMKEYFESCKKLTSEYKDRISTYHKLLEKHNEKTSQDIKPNFNGSSLDVKFDNIQAEQKNLSSQKTMGKDKLKGLTGVVNMVVDKSPFGNDTTNKDSSLSNGVIGGNRGNMEGGNFIIEQKNQFFRRKKKEMLTATEDKDVNRYDRYGNLIPSKKSISTVTSTTRRQDGYELNGKQMREKIDSVSVDKYRSIEPVKVNGGDVNGSINAPAVNDNLLKPPVVNEAVDMNDHAINNQLDPPVADRDENRINPIRKNQLKPPGNVEKGIKYDDGNRVVRKLVPYDQLVKPKQVKSKVGSTGNNLNNKIPPVRPAVKPLDGNQIARMDVKKVTLDEDENGDQNLDNNGEEPDKEMGANFNDLNDGDPQNNKQDLEEGLQEGGIVMKR